MDRSWKAFGERWIVSFPRDSSRRDSSRVKSPKWVGMANSSEGSHSKAPSLPEECSLSASENRSARGSPELPQSLSILRSRLWRFARPPLAHRRLLCEQGNRFSDQY